MILDITKVKVNQRFSIILPLGLKSFVGGPADCFAKNWLVWSDVKKIIKPTAAPRFQNLVPETQ